MKIAPADFYHIKKWKVSVVNKSLGLDLAWTVMEIGKKSKTTLVLFFKCSTLIWKHSWAITLSAEVFKKQSQKPLSGTILGNLGSVGDSFAPLTHCLFLNIIYTAYVVFVSEYF